MRIFLAFAYDIAWVVMWGSAYALGCRLHAGESPLGFLFLAVLCRGCAGAAEKALEREW